MAGSGAGRSRRERARARLVKRLGEQDDSKLVNEALQGVFTAVSSRGPLTEEQANQLVYEETERMRAEKRERGRVDAGRRSK